MVIRLMLAVPKRTDAMAEWSGVRAAYLAEVRPWGRHLFAGLARFLPETGLAGLIQSGMITDSHEFPPPGVG